MLLARVEELVGAQSHSGSTGVCASLPAPGKRTAPAQTLAPPVPGSGVPATEPTGGTDKLASSPTPPTPEPTSPRCSPAWPWNPAAAPAETLGRALRSHCLLVGEAPRLPVQRQAPGLERPGRAGHRVLQLLDDHEEQEEKQEEQEEEERQVEQEVELPLHAGGAGARSAAVCARRTRSRS